MKWIIHIVFISLYILVVFFGLGPVLLADGVATERLITAAIVLTILVLISFLYRFLLRKIG